MKQKLKDFLLWLQLKKEYHKVFLGTLKSYLVLIINLYVFIFIIYLLFYNNIAIQNLNILLKGVQELIKPLLHLFFWFNGSIDFSLWTMRIIFFLILLFNLILLYINTLWSFMVLLSMARASYRSYIKYQTLKLNTFTYMGFTFIKLNNIQVDPFYTFLVNYILPYYINLILLLLILLFIYNIDKLCSDLLYKGLCLLFLKFYIIWGLLFFLLSFMGYSEHSFSLVNGLRDNFLSNSMPLCYNK